ncbi:MAG: GIY-YIG nuclease family protein [Paracoccaceae bacterium]
MTQGLPQSMQGRSLELFFIDGRPDGMLTAEVFNWTGHVLMTPRTQIAKALAREESKRTGVYLLLGDRDGNPLAYIGEAEEVGRRLKEHAVAKDWWTSAVLITTAGDGLHKAHVKYLESRLVEIARAVGSMPLENGNLPPRPSLSEAHVANMEVFLESLILVLPALRIDMLLNKRRSNKSDQPTADEAPLPTFELTNRKHGIQATAVLEGGEFVVRKGSLARANWQGSTQEKSHYFKLHQELVETGVLTLNGDKRVFETNYAFSSTSAAGAVVNGRSTRGPTEWKLQGTSLTYKDWEAEQLSAQEIRS